MKHQPSTHILIVEDEVLLAHTMKEMLHELGYQQIQLANTFTLGKAVLSEKPIDLALLDINIEGGEEGIELAKLCHKKGIPFLYVTSYTDKSTLDRALETAPGAYLIKPFLPSNLYTAVEISLRKGKDEEQERFTFKNGSEVVNLPVDQILYLKADNVYVNVVTHSKTYLYRSSLSGALGLLPKEKFKQTHRSYVVNLKYVSKVRSKAIEIGEIDIPLSRTFKDQLKAFVLKV